MIWFLLQKIGFFIFLFLTIYFVYKKKYEGLLVLYFFGMAFTTCYYYAFTIWFPVKIIALGMIFCLFFEQNKRCSSALQVIYPMAALFIMAILLSDIIGICFQGSYAIRINRYVRMFNSNYTYVTTVVLLFFGLILERGFVKRLYPIYCLAVEIAIGFGLLHFVCLKLGINFMPLLRQDGTVNLEAIAQMGGHAVSRIYGVTGEPKNLGFLICPYLLASMIMLGQGIYRINKKYHLVTLLAGMFVLINTYSSSALINFFLAVPLVMMLFPLPKTSYKAAAFIVSLCVVVCLVRLVDETNLYKGQTNDSSFVEQLYDRTFVRAQNEMEDDRQESVILEHLASENNMIHILFGWGVSQYTFHVPGQTIGKSFIPVQSGLVLTLADFGLVGVILLFSLCYVILRILKLSLKSMNIYAQVFSVAALSSFIGSLMFGTIVTCFIYLMLALYAYYDEEELSVIKDNIKV